MILLLTVPQNTVGSFYEKTDYFIGPFLRRYFLRRDIIFNNYACNYNYLCDITNGVLDLEGIRLDISVILIQKEQIR